MPARLAGLASIGVCLVLLVAPFERIAPLVQLPWQSISNLEVALGLVIVAWVAWAVATRTRVRLPAGIGLPWFAALVVLGVSAVLAPADRGNAINMVGRFAAGLVIATFTAMAVSTRARLDRVLVAALVTGSVVALLVVLDHAQVARVLGWLDLFRTGRAVLGGVLRASGPFQYPTIAAMFLEVTFALGLGVLLSLLAARRWTFVAVVFGALALAAGAIALTLTRAGAGAILASLVVAGACVARKERRRAIIALGALGLTALALFAASRSSELLLMRFTSEGQEGWYRASFLDLSDVRMRARGTTLVEVRVRNDGGVTWDSAANPPYFLSYHWLERDAMRVVHFEGRRTPFPARVGPGQTITVTATVEGPPSPGRYRLAWDVVLENRLWFSTEPGITPATVAAEVDGVDVGPRAREARAYPATAVRPGRLTLWGAALRMVAAHPLLGIGPDNFRLYYGRYAGIPAADPRIHSNSLYLEWLVGGGLFGALACGWLLWRATATVVSAAQRAAARPAAAGVAAAWTAVLLHGLVDTFLGFTPTYVVIAITLGLAAAIVAWEDAGDANPV